MRPVKFDPATLDDATKKQWWADWTSDASAATLKAIVAWEEWLVKRDTPEFDYKFQDRIWKQLKTWLLENAFHFKCAYCEAPLDLDRYFGDAEHFRPKGQVTYQDDNGKKIRAKCTLLSGEQINHPGYFWLAYNWKNLVPACSFCNSGDAKVDQFPARKYFLARRLTTSEKKALQQEPMVSPADPDICYLDPADLDALEDPYLLNPLNVSEERKPQKHLRFGIAGKVVALDSSPYGAESIRVYKLTRERLRIRRQEAQEQIHRIYYQSLAEPDPNLKAKLEEKLRMYRSGQKEYSAAALDYLRDAIEAQRVMTEEIISQG
jgi:hypothetical protein